MIIAIAMNDCFADNGPNIKPPAQTSESMVNEWAEMLAGKPKNKVFPEFDLPPPDNSFVMSREWFRNELNKNLERRRLIAHGGIDIPLKPITTEGATNGDQSETEA